LFDLFSLGNKTLLFHKIIL